MNLPCAHEAVVPRSKVERYLLNPDHPEGSGKARFFTRFGFRRDDWPGLSAALCGHAQTQPVVRIVETEFSTRYVVEGILKSPDGRNPRLRTIWVVDKGSLAPRFITAYPLVRDD